MSHFYIDGDKNEIPYEGSKFSTILETNFTFSMSAVGGTSSDTPKIRFGENISKTLMVNSSSSLQEY